MELKVEPVCGRNYVVQESGGEILKKSLLGENGCSLPSSRGVCWNPLTRSLMVCDTLKCCVRMFGASFTSDESVRMSLNCDDKGEYVSTIGSQGSSPGQFICPVAVTVNMRGEIAVADGKLNRVQVFSGGGDLEHLFGRTGTGRGEFRGLSDVKFLPRGYLAIADPGNDRIQITSVTGVIVQIVGRYGWKLGEFAQPSSLAVTRSGDLFVCDQGNKRIQRFSAKGKALLAWGSRRGRSPMADGIDFASQQPLIYSVFDIPCDIAIGVNDEVIVCDSGKQQLLVFSDVGACLHVIKAPTVFKSCLPTAVANCSNMLVVIGRTNTLGTTVDALTSDVQENDLHNCFLAAFPPARRLRMGRFAPIPAHIVTATISFLCYSDVLHLRLANRYFHQVCRKLRNEWKLFPFVVGHATVMKYNRVISPATGLVAVEEAFEKWGLRIHKPTNNIRKHVMDFQAGFCSALSSLYEPLFCYQHEDILRVLFHYYTTSTKEEIGKAAFIEIVTEIQEVRAGFRLWKQCVPFTGAKAASVPAIRTADNLQETSNGVPVPKSLQLVENAQQHQLSKLLRKLRAL